MDMRTSTQSSTQVLILIVYAIIELIGIFGTRIIFYFLWLDYGLVWIFPKHKPHKFNSRKGNLYVILWSMLGSNKSLTKHLLGNISVSHLLYLLTGKRFILQYIVITLYTRIIANFFLVMALWLINAFKVVPLRNWLLFKSTVIPMSNFKLFSNENFNPCNYLAPLEVITRFFCLWSIWYSS